jgi:phenylpropionate dioxygenase-like ring-hydroxylating dioxygenase large terminal subunit
MSVSSDVSQPLPAAGMHKGQSVASHAHEKCRSLRCPLHEWTADLNGNLHLVAKAERDDSDFPVHKAL